MNHVPRIALLCLVFVITFCCIAPLWAQTSRPIDAGVVETITGAKSTLNKDENVLKVTFPRTDVHVTVDGAPLPPFMGLTSWAAFTPGSGDKTMVMGDLVLFPDEVNAAMDAALENGLTVTALHNHFFFDEPRVMFMHVGGEGSTEQLATGVRKVLDKVAELRRAHPQPQTTFSDPTLPAKSAVSAAPLAAALGTKPAEKDGMVKFVFGRTTNMACGCAVGKEMGVNTWAAFMGDDEHAVVDGDFVTFAGELQPVLKALRAGGIRIVAIHNHMEGDDPKAIFLHYWGVGRPAQLADGIKHALDTQKK